MENQTFEMKQQTDLETWSENEKRKCKFERKKKNWKIFQKSCSNVCAQTLRNKKGLYVKTSILQ